MNSPDLKLALGQTVPGEVQERLAVFVALVERWNPKINLIARNGISDIWTRHIADSVQLFRHLPGSPSRLTDLGSGGGFPGIVLAIISATLNPACDHTLIESDQRKAAFLREAIRATGIRASVLAERIETAPPQASDVVTARALAPLETLLGLASRHLNESGVAIFPKGVGYPAELEAAREAWDFSVDAVPSATDPQARVLVLRNIRPPKQRAGET